MKNGTASIVVTRCNSGVFTLEIQDDMSGAIVCRVNMNPKQFADAITARHTTGVAVTWLGLEMVGKRREVKTERVLVPDGPFESQKERAATAVAALEVDGWEGRVTDAGNMHRRRGGNIYEVTYTRFVETAED